MCLCISCHSNNPLALQSKEKIIKICVSSTFSHIAVTSNTSDNEIKLSVYLLPLDSWLSELPHTEERWSQSSVPSVKKGTTPHTDVCTRPEGW